MNDPVLARILLAFDSADGHQIGMIDDDLAALRARCAPLAAAGVRVQESPYVAFARRLAGNPGRSPMLAASA